MNKAVIFDMDGVIINSEFEWEKQENVSLRKMCGDEIYEKIHKQIMGGTIQMITKLIQDAGKKIPGDEVNKIFDEMSIIVYKNSKVTPGIKECIKILKSLGFRIGLVTAAKPFWVEQVRKKLKNDNLFDYYLALSERNDLNPKPFPDGYLEAMKNLSVTPEQTIIIEDSQRGIDAAKASGAFTICLLENLKPGLMPNNADMYVKSIIDFTKLMNNFS